jgi:arylsulfate sulfotransferase
MMFFNNGNGRLLDASNNVCGAPGITAGYSSVPLFQINGTTKSASLVSETILAPNFSICCGDAQTLSNRNVEYDVAADVMTPGQSLVEEVGPGPMPQRAWQMNIGVSLTCRGFRIPSLYPGVTWTESEITAANTSVAKR